jgi:hypothetical protein
MKEEELAFLKAHLAQLPANATTGHTARATEERGRGEMNGRQPQGTQRGGGVARNIRVT